MLICLSDNDLAIITFKISSVGNSIPIDTKLLILEFKSFSLKLICLIESLDLLIYNYQVVLIDLKMSKKFH